MPYWCCMGDQSNAMYCKAITILWVIQINFTLTVFDFALYPTILFLLFIFLALALLMTCSMIAWYNLCIAPLPNRDKPYPSSDGHHEVTSSDEGKWRHVL